MGTDPNKVTEDSLRVEHFMIPLADYPKVTSDASLRDALRVMKDAELNINGRRSLPRVLLVCGENDYLVGYVRRRDVLLGMEPKTLRSDPVALSTMPFNLAGDPLLSELTSEHMIRGMQANADRPITDVLHAVRDPLSHDDSILTALYRMRSLGVPLLPIESGGRTLGVIRSVEIFRELAHLII